MDFNPPIASRTTAELLKIASDPNTWQPEAQALAWVELDKRGVPLEQIRSREEDLKRTRRAHHELLERHAKESYSVLQLIGIFLIAPFLIIGKILGQGLFLEVKLGLSELDRRNYKKKYRQRMAMLIAGPLFWYLLIVWISN